MVDRLIKIASSIEAKSLLTALQDIKHRMGQPNTDVIVPLVGEFSAGKTTLINELTDSKALETSTLPTTATIFEIHFGMPSCRATVYNPDGSSYEECNIANLKNEKLKDARIVCVEDTSSKVPQGITIVDTPGLSSTDVRHKKALVDFLPMADAVMLVVDINQQVTRSLTDFVETMNLAKRPVFLVITKCDSKSQSEIQSSRKYISDNCKLPLDRTVCVSATNGDISELNKIFETIQRDKKRILDAVNSQRLFIIAKDLDERICDILSKTKSDKALQEAFHDVKDELTVINRNIASLIDSMKGDIDDSVIDISRQFEELIFPKLDAIVTAQGTNFDADVVSEVNSTASILMSNFQTKIASILSTNCQKRIGTDRIINLQSLRQLDLSQLEIGHIGANLGLNTLGHENDETIGKAVLVVGALACLPAAAGAAGTGTAVAALDTATDVASVAYTAHAVSKMQKMQDYSDRLRQGMEKVEVLDSQYGQKLGQNNGIIASCVGFFTERFTAKPKRQKAIRAYIASELIPEFKRRLNALAINLLQHIQDTILAEAQNTIDEKTNMLNSLKTQCEEEKAAFEARRKELESYRVELQNI